MEIVLNKKGKKIYIAEAEQSMREFLDILKTRIEKKLLNRIVLQVDYSEGDSFLGKKIGFRLMEIIPQKMRIGKYVIYENEAHKPLLSAAIFFYGEWYVNLMSCTLHDSKVGEEFLEELYHHAKNNEMSVRLGQLALV